MIEAVTGASILAFLIIGFICIVLSEVNK